MESIILSILFGSGNGYAFNYDDSFILSISFVYISKKQYFNLYLSCRFYSTY